MKIKHHPVFGEQVKKEVDFTFEGMSYTGFDGQTVAGALLANRIFDISKSKKLQEPRGIYCMNGRCYECFVTVDGVEHTIACTTKVKEGMEVRRNIGPPTLRSGCK